jgi:PAS domain S-box-containing protein
MNILIVDDNEDARIIIKKALESEGYTVKAVTNGKEALEAARESVPHMIVSDILMPVMDGFQLCREVRLDPALKETPFVFYTATYTDEKDKELALKVGADRYIVKPVEPKELVSVIKGVFSDVGGRKTGGEPPLAQEEEETLKLYNERLVKKLEKKMLDLERSVAKRRETEERYRVAIEHSNDGVTLLKGDKLIFANKRFADIFGYGETHEIVGKPLSLFVHPDDLERVTQLAVGRQTGKPVSKQYEFKGIRQDGTPVFIEVSAAGITYLGQAASLAYHRDITARKEAEEALKESESNFRLLLESTAEAIYGLDLEGSCTFANAACVRLLGYENSDALIGKNMHNLTHHSHPDGSPYPEKECPMNLAFKKGEKIHSDDEVLWRADKTSFPAEYWSHPIYRRDRIAGAVMTFLNITERKETEEALLKSEAQLQQAQKREAIGTLAGGIAHDFNNILSAIIGYSELARMKVPEESEMMVDLDQVLQAGNRARALVLQILTVSRRHKQEQQPLQLRYIVKEALSLIRATLPTTIEIREDLANDAGIVNADPNQIHQVIMNLCTNAGHAMDKNGGVLTVALGNVEMDELSSPYVDMEPGSYLRMTVSDTGCGITPEMIEQIFDPYFTTRDVGEGTGLGLSVSHGIVKGHGGAIRVYSEPGKGSTFNVYLPVIQEAEKKVEAPVGPLPTGNERVLFIDDEQTIADMGRQMLERLGYEVVAMTSSIKALELFRAEPGGFDLVITDMTMPHMTGDKLAKELMKIRHDIPVILCTGHSRHASKEKAKELGIRTFFMKPILMRALAETVREALDGK